MLSATAQAAGTARAGGSQDRTARAGGGRCRGRTNLARDLAQLDPGGCLLVELRADPDAHARMAIANARFAEPGRPFLTACLALRRRDDTEEWQARQNAFRLAYVVAGLDPAVAEVLDDPDCVVAAMSNLATIVSRVPSTDLLLKIMNNAVLLGRGYTHVDLLSDMASINLTMVNGRKVLGRLGNPMAVSAKGSCYEIRSAAWLKQNRREEIRAWDGRMARREYDFLTTTGNVCQCKASSIAFDSAQREIAWSQLALQQTATKTYRQVKWLTPSKEQVPAGLVSWFRQIERDTGQEIEIIPVPLAW